MNTRIVMLGMVILSLAACDRGVDDEGRVRPDDSCQSGVSWSGGDEESPEMHPGRDCIGCHRSEGEGPSFLAAGTVFPALDDADDCYGVGGVTVELTGTDGAKVSTVTNDAGNFFFASQQVALAFPFSARLLLDGRERPMSMPQTNGSCATCHTAHGQSGAPGRILAP